MLLERGYAMKKSFADLPGWIFDMNEISAGVYEIIAKDSTGCTVSAKGIDLELLIDQCRLDAHKISSHGSDQGSMKV
jgi:hypothetical protein